MRWLMIQCSALMMVHNDYVLDPYDPWRSRMDFWKSRMGVVFQLILFLCFQPLSKYVQVGTILLSGGEYPPRGEPWTLFWTKIGLGIQWSYSQVLKVPGSALIFRFLVFGFWFLNFLHIIWHYLHISTVLLSLLREINTNELVIHYLPQR